MRSTLNQVKAHTFADDCIDSPSKIMKPSSHKSILFDCSSLRWSAIIDEEKADAGKVNRYGGSPLSLNILRNDRFPVDLAMVSIIHSPPQELVVTGLTSFSSQQNLASMIAFVMNVSGQPMALYWAEGVVFLADFVEPEALPDEYVKGKIYASNVSHAPMAKYNNMIRVGNMEVPVIDVSSNVALRDLARWIRENHQSSPDKS